MQKTEKDLSITGRSIWLRAQCASEIRNYGHAVAVYQELLKEEPLFLAARKAARSAALELIKGRKKVSQPLAPVAFVNPTADPYADLEAAEKILARDPYSPAGNRLLRDAAFALGEVDTAVFALEIWLEGDPGNAEVARELASLTGKAVPFVAAPPKPPVPIVVTAIPSAPAPVVAEAEPTPQTLEEKILAFTDAAFNEPENPLLAQKVAELYEEKHDLENALAWFRHADVLAEGEDAGIREKITELEVKRVGSEIKEREEWLLQDAEHHQERGRIRKEVEELREWKNSVLLEDARKRVAESPQDAGLNYEFGELLVNAGEFSEAIPRLQKARWHPELGMLAATLLGNCYSAKGMHDLALRQFTGEAREMDEAEKLMVYQLGKLYDSRGEKEKALECFKQIYEVDYGYRDVAARVESSYALV